jgi:hypothetical protein
MDYEKRIHGRYSNGPTIAAGKTMKPFAVSSVPSSQIPCTVAQTPKTVTRCRFYGALFRRKPGIEAQEVRSTPASTREEEER